MISFLNNPRFLLNSILEFFITISALFTLPSAELSVCSLGTTLILAIKSPANISSPSSTYISCIIPAI